MPDTRVRVTTGTGSTRITATSCNTVILTGGRDFVRLRRRRFEYQADDDQQRGKAQKQPAQLPGAVGGFQPCSSCAFGRAIESCW